MLCLFWESFRAHTKKQNQIFNFQCICSYQNDQMKDEATLPNHTKQCQRFSVRSKNKKIKGKSSREKTTETYRKKMKMNMKYKFICLHVEEKESPCTSPFTTFHFKTDSTRAVLINGSTTGPKTPEVTSCIIARAEWDSSLWSTPLPTTTTTC